MIKRTPHSLHGKQLTCGGFPEYQRQHQHLQCIFFSLQLYVFFSFFFNYSLPRFVFFCLGRYSWCCARFWSSVLDLIFFFIFLLVLCAADFGRNFNFFDCAATSCQIERLSLRWWFCPRFSCAKYASSNSSEFLAFSCFWYAFQKLVWNKIVSEFLQMTVPCGSLGRRFLFSTAGDDTGDIGIDHAGFSPFDSVGRHFFDAACTFYCPYWCSCGIENAGGLICAL